MLKVTMDNEKVTIQANSSRECVEVLQYLYPEYTKHLQRLNGVIEKEELAPDFSELLKDTAKQGIIKLSNTVEPKVAKPTYERPVHSPEDKPKRKLVFFKCRTCGSISATLIDEGQKEVHCRECSTDTELGKLVYGKYDCECGAYGRFLMQDSVPEIRCKDCGKLHIMTYNADWDRYESTENIDLG